jgi:hypothetical protein
MPRSFAPPQRVQCADRVARGAAEHRGGDRADGDAGDRDRPESGAGLVEGLQYAVLVGAERAAALQDDRGVDIPGRHEVPPGAGKPTLSSVPSRRCVGKYAVVRSIQLKASAADPPIPPVGLQR